MFKLSFRPRALRSLKKAERRIQLQINFALNELGTNNFNVLDIRKIEGSKYGHRLRVGRWRILFSLFSGEKRIEIVDIFLKKGYQDYQKRKQLLK